MPERGRQHHWERVGEALKEEIGAIIEGELGDPRIALCTVSEISLAPDGKSARVFLQVEGDEKVINEIEVLPPSPNHDRIRGRVYAAIGHRGGLLERP